MNKIKVITPFYNPGKFLETSVISVLNQEYENFEVIYVDDCSTDGSNQYVPRDNEKVKLIVNEQRKTALENLHNVIMNHCDKDDIVAIVDGDDALSTPKALNIVNDIYNSGDYWIVYGASFASDGTSINSKAYTEQEFRDLRKWNMYVSHMRTFKAGLYFKIQEQDPEFKCLKDNKGEFYKMTYDCAMLFPMMEMAGFERVKYNNKKIYIYNRENPISDCYVNEQLQKSIHAEINNKPKFKKIDSI